MSNFLKQFILPATSSQPTVKTTLAQIIALVESNTTGETYTKRQLFGFDYKHALGELGYIWKLETINDNDIMVYNVVTVHPDFATILSNHNTPLI